MIKQDIYENQAKDVFLAIGSNLGDRFKNIELAKIMLSDNKIKILKSSSFYETLSWPNPNYPKFYNVVLKVKTNLKVLELLTICKQIEISLGRKKTPKNSPRICDIDILDYLGFLGSSVRNDASGGAPPRRFPCSSFGARSQSRGVQVCPLTHSREVSPLG